VRRVGGAVEEGLSDRYGEPGGYRRRYGDPRPVEALVHDGQRAPLVPLLQAFLVQDIVMNSHVPLSYLLTTIPGVVGEGLDEPQLAVERTEIISLQVHVEIGVDLHESAALVPALGGRVIARPRLQADDASPTCAFLCFG
jgi:hypothetical protein